MWSALINWTTNHFLLFFLSVLPSFFILEKPSTSFPYNGGLLRLLYHALWRHDHMISPLARFFMISLFPLYSGLRMCLWLPDLEIIILNTQSLQILEDSELANATRRIGTGLKTEEQIFSLNFFLTYLIT